MGFCAPALQAVGLYSLRAPSPVFAFTLRRVSAIR
jgi:hypothetical protein